MIEKSLNVIVFGAGASYHIGAPLTNQLLYKGFNLLDQDNSKELSIESFRKVATFIDVLYGSTVSIILEQMIRGDQIFLQNDWIPSVTLEELFTFIDIGISNGQGWIPPFKELQSAMYDFIFETLDYKTDRSNGLQFHDDGTFSRSHDTRFDILLDRMIDLNSKNCLITLNYDLFLDSAVFINHQNSFGNYNLKFDLVEHIPEYIEKTTEPSNKENRQLIDILKLHGSLNWAHCNNCNRNSLAFARQYKQYKRTPCQNCSGTLRPIIVPPTLKKRINETGLKSVWDKAHEILKNADTITIIGYSFPDADVEAKWLFKKAVAEGCRNPLLTLVEPCKHVRDKIRGFFGQTVKFHGFYDKFEDYCEQART